MLYVTTRNQREYYTAHRALWERRGPDGGFYIPFRVKPFSPVEIVSLKEKSFHAIAADILNLLFQSRLTAEKLELAIGRNPVALTSMRHRILIGECWRGSGWDFSGTIRSIAQLLRPDASIPGKWLETGVRIAYLFGIFGTLFQSGIVGPDDPVDIAVTAGDFSEPMSVWYARAWGLPIGNIVCCCNENSAVWDFLNHGQLRTDKVCVSTVTKDVDFALPEELECLISCVCGDQEALRFVEACRTGRTYTPSDAAMQRLKDGLYAGVISSRRILETIPRVYTAAQRVLSPYDALTYLGVLDYRSQTGQIRPALTLSMTSPAKDTRIIAEAMGIPTQEAQALLIDQGAVLDGNAGTARQGG